MIALFPGQGSQFVGMGKSLCDNFQLAREIFEEASDAIKVPLTKLCFDGPQADLNLTENTQPALLTASIAAFRVAQAETGFVPLFVAGHSLGEYSALVAAGSIGFSCAIRWVRERGRLMQQAVPAGNGSMAAVMGLSDEDTARLCRLAVEQAKAGGHANAVLEPANYNAPGQIVISGTIAALEAADAIVRAGTIAGARLIPLSVSAPFHSSLMKPASEAMKKVFGAAAPYEKPKQPRCPYVPNRTARPTQESGVVFELLIEQIHSPVLWKQSIEALLQTDNTVIVEFGPGRVLQGLVKRICKEACKSATTASVGDTDAIKSLKGTLA